MGALRERLVFDEAAGAVLDADRRYLLMRADVLMGALHALDDPARQALLQALAGAAAQFGGRSLDAYAAAGGDRAALVASTAAAAADLGWGRWSMALDDSVVPPALALEVRGSPFAAGWRLAAGPATEAGPPPCVCAPIAGMLQALAGRVLPSPEAGPATARETACAAQGAASCRFTASR